MLEIRTEYKRADALLIGDSWIWGGEFYEVSSVTNVYVDMKDTGLVRVIGKRHRVMDAWTLDADQMVEVEA